MNWRRGLLRLWLVLSLCWIVAVGLYAWPYAWPPYCRLLGQATTPNEQRNPPGTFTPIDPNEPAPPETWPCIAATINEFAPYALLPPLVTLVLGLLGVWVASGFARRGT
jgi:hypothetical protein